jgi:hypothetical protein
MLNIEKYKDEIKEIMQKSYNLTAYNLMESLERFMAEKTEKNIENICITNVFDWLSEEYKEPVLNETEKAYLSAVIKPFKANVTGICKINICRGFYCIRIYAKSISSELRIEVIDLPLFETGTMYKGMETDKHYSLEELGL